MHAWTSVQGFDFLGNVIGQAPHGLETRSVPETEYDAHCSHGASVSSVNLLSGMRTHEVADGLCQRWHSLRDRQKPSKNLVRFPGHLGKLIHGPGTTTLGEHRASSWGSRRKEHGWGMKRASRWWCLRPISGRLLWQRSILIIWGPRVQQLNLSRSR